MEDRKMKKNIVFALSVLTLFSCSGFLDEKQTTGLQESTYASEVMLESNIYGILSQFSGTWGVTGEPMEFYSQASALTHWGGSARLGKPKWEAVLRFTQYSTNDVNNNYFKTIYAGINCCNVLIGNLKDSPVDEAYKKQIEAEAKFYRGVLYFTAVRIWGDLPLRIGNIDVQTATNCPRTHYTKIYEQIVKDFTEAAQGMRTPEQVRSHYIGIPRPDKYAPTAYLSSVFVTIGSLLASTDDNFWDNTRKERLPDFSALGVNSSDDAYKKALDYAESLIPESGKRDAGCRYELVGDYSDLFHFDPAYGSVAYDNPEQIFVLSYSPNSVTGYHAFRTLPQYCEGTLDCVESSHNGNTGRFRPNRWVFQKWCETYPGEVHPNYPGLYVTSSDPRLDASLYHTSILNACTGAESEIYPQKISNSKTAVYPYFKKYWSTAYNMNNGTASFYCMRFAQVYLDAAEAAAALGEDAKAYKYIDVIHARARKSGGASSAEPANWTDNVSFTGQDLLDRIFWERVFELYGEGHEWNDVHRHGANWIVKNISIPKNAFFDRPENANLRSKGSDHASYDAGFYYSTEPNEIRKGLLAAFPNNEFLYNKGISYDDQNEFFIE